MTEYPGFVAKQEAEGINVSTIRPLKEALLLVIGIIGGALLLFTIVAVVIEYTAPLIPPSLEYRLFGRWATEMAVSGDSQPSEMRHRSQQVLARLIESGPNQPFPIKIAVQPSDEINAFAMPGGLILITTGMMQDVESDEELAFVVGHELGHFANRDHLRGLGRGVAAVVVSGILGATGVGSPALTLIDHFDLLASRSMDRQQEIAADAYGLKLLLMSYGDSRGGELFLARLEKAEGGATWLGYLETHPESAQRIIALSQKSSP